jgi:hypothetical protein
VAHGLPTVAPPDGSDAEPVALYEWHDGVRITDRDSGIVYEVVPVMRENNAVDVRHYSETGIRGPLPELPQNVFPRLYLAMIAQEFLEGDVDGVFGKPGRPSENREPLPRPDDERLVRTVARLFATYNAANVPAARKTLSPRSVLAEQYGIKERTADEWIRRAREIAPDVIPAPTTGRPRKEPS